MTYTDEEKRVYMAWLNFYESSTGKIIFEDLEKKFRLQVSHVVGDPYSTAFRDGQRDGAYNAPLKMVEVAREILEEESKNRGE